jgi:hypothetical protein
MPNGHVLVGRCHGGWTAADGFVAIPADTKLFLFQNPGDLMDAIDADQPALQVTTALESKQGTAAWTLEADDIAYDYGTSPLGAADYGQDGVMDILQGPSAEGVEIVGGDKLLSAILSEHKGKNIYWLACQAYAGIPGNEQDEILQYGRLLTDEEKTQKSDDELKAMMDPAKVKRV